MNEDTSGPVTRESRRGAASSTVTRSPSLCSAYAASSPSRPPPATTARCACCRCAYARSAIASRPQQAMRYTRLALTQRLRATIEQELGYGLMLEGMAILAGRAGG